MANPRPPLLRRALVVVIIVVGLRLATQSRRVTPVAPPPAGPVTNPAPSASIDASANQALRDAANQQRSNVQLLAVGRVIRLLPDDNEGSRHQKFLFRAAPDLTVLVAYNLDLAPRIPLAIGDSVQVRGEYIWNEKGGLIHWAHKDPAGQHQPGWVELNGKRYQ
ncbi:MAG: DUF3465 domain-containing protein [Gemmatimonadota bacterium]